MARPRGAVSHDRQDPFEGGQVGFGAARTAPGAAPGAANKADGDAAPQLIDVAPQDGQGGRAGARDGVGATSSTGSSLQRGEAPQQRLPDRVLPQGDRGEVAEEQYAFAGHHRRVTGTVGRGGAGGIRHHPPGDAVGKEAEEILLVVVVAAAAAAASDGRADGGGLRNARLARCNAADEAADEAEGQ